METHDISFKQALASIKIVKGAGVADLTADEFEFLTQNVLWLAADRKSVARVIESALYGATDMVGLPRLELPAEFGAATIVALVHPINYQYACHAIEGLPWNGDLKGEVPNASDIFGLVLKLSASMGDAEALLRTLKENFAIAEEA